MSRQLRYGDAEEAGMSAPRVQTIRRLDAVYPLASATKPITATCAMCLVEHGLLGLNRPVLEYVPELTGDRKDAVMVHHLTYRSLCRPARRCRIATSTTRLSYCNLNYKLLAEIVGRVAASPTARFAQERVFEPLG
jgi:CubicO group peptidase (beta-lactamase class C family)